jgi:hypothetical protein
MAKRRSPKKKRGDPKKLLKAIQTDTRRLDAKRFDKVTGKFGEAEEVRIRAAITRLKKNFKDLSQCYFPFEFGRPK